MTEDMGYHTLVNLNRVLCDGGYCFIKLNPFYSDEELASLNYEEMGRHMYGESGILHLKQGSTPYWMKVFEEMGEVERYVEFPYEWQPGMNRLFLVRKKYRKIETYWLTIIVIYVIVQIEQRRDESLNQSSLNTTLWNESIMLTNKRVIS